MICGACNENVHPVQEMRANGRGFQTKCPRAECGSPMPEIERIEVMAPPEERAVLTTTEAPQPRVLQHDITARPVAAVASAVTAESDILAMSRARLAQVELRLSEHDRLQAEARRLRAMIAAAEATESN